MANRVPGFFRVQARWALEGAFTAPATSAILDTAERRYVAPPPVARTAGGRLNLRLAAYLLALRDALLESGVAAEDANGLLADALFRVMHRFYRLTDAIAMIRHPVDRAARGRWRQGLSRRLYFRPPDWVMADVRGSRFYAFDVKRCLLADYMRERGESEFCRQVVCAQDLLLAQDRGETLVRTETIAAGSPRCDFRFIDLLETGARWKPEF